VCKRCRNSFPFGGQGKKVPYPAGFDHVIVLPHKVAQIIYQYDWKQGETFFNSLKNAVQPGATSTNDCCNVSSDGLIFVLRRESANCFLLDRSLLFGGHKCDRG
jgi:hypothetical protein